jgi:hypothetical protein
MSETEIFTPEQPKRSGVVDVIMSIVIVFVLTLMFLWNWDGFWQTKLPALVAVQKTYLPVKYNEEQLKLGNNEASEKLLVAAQLKVIELEKEIVRLNREITAADAETVRAE